MTTDVMHYLKDPSKLTPYEEKLLALRQQGLTYTQMSKALGGTSKPNSIATCFRTIKEKIELAEAFNEQ